MRGWENVRRSKPKPYFFAFSILPAPPHFVQLSPFLAFSTQQACEQDLPLACAFAQQPATLLAAFSAANITPAAKNAAAITSNDLVLFMFLVGVY